jgi:hypothetical protein
MLNSGVFMHDYRIKAENVKVRTTRQFRANTTVKDTFYWPDMTVGTLVVHRSAKYPP